jgi:RimJ/RimL family protein N-acetyltransferase
VAWAFAHHDVDEVFSVILPENAASAAVARRLGFGVVETRIVSHFPRAPHDI